ncbi:hypothetical protein [Jannaschia rubra]|uniref:Enoyl-CoA hydratase n=1 Tax=Jannaschia rubra TaxID=282197 RepID=A0A0M6XUB6_9RHOB|nr:hypothetical protein [Jannaschia rubra]CTQ33534.1 hypothetical protein JAN5088_02316 [Jannaschia rubra]SFG03367.1 hypothetical protein SAMN04488517_102363 [Jannaschia rubra]
MQRHFVAFYRGRGTLADRIVQYATRSPFSHCELIRAATPPRLGEVATCLSASGRDGGVRIKDIELTPDKWCIYEVTWAPRGTWERAEARLGEPYELWSMVLSQLFNFRRQARGRWFCSELVAHALRLDMPHFYAPGDLLRAIRDHTDTWNDARASFADGEPDGLIG